MPSHDEAKRRLGKRAGREKGCWLYVTSEQLVAAGFRPTDPPPYYRVWKAAGGRPRFFVNLYREP